MTRVRRAHSFVLELTDRQRSEVEAGRRPPRGLHKPMHHKAQGLTEYTTIAAAMAIAVLVIVLVLSSLFDDISANVTTQVDDILADTGVNDDA